MSEPSPAYLWYPNDILSSGKVNALEPLEELWYRRALDHCWMSDGIPGDPEEFAGWVGRGCTVEAAQKIIAKFFHPHKKDKTKVINNRQEKERKKLLKSRKQKSDAGKEGMRKRWQQRNNSDNTVITDDNISIPIPIPISIPISEFDFKRLILRVREDFPQADERLVEIGILHTMMQRNGSTDAIKSTKYFHPEIKSVMQDSAKLSSRTIDAMVEARRKQFWKQAEERSAA